MAFTSNTGHRCIAVLSGKGAPELRGPTLGCMSSIDKKSAHFFCKDNCIDLPHER